MKNGSFFNIAVEKKCYIWAIAIFRKIGFKVDDWMKYTALTNIIENFSATENLLEMIVLIKLISKPITYE